MTDSAYVNAGYDTVFQSGQFVNDDVDASESVMEIDATRVSRMWIQFTVAGNALTGFIVQFRCNPNAAFDTIASIASDYTAPEGPILGASGDLTTAAVGSHWIKLDVSGLDRIKFLAAGTNSVITGYFGGN